MKSRTTLAIISMLTVLFVAAPAEAHYRFNIHRWLFGGSTYSDGKRTDPVNMFFSQAGTKSEIDGHFNDHWGPDPAEWIEHESLPGKCRGDQDVRFRDIGNPSTGFTARPTDFHGVGVGRSSGRCFNRYHIRFWGDAFHEQVFGVSHGPNQDWTIGGAHYEELAPTHEPALDWDVVEHRVSQIMRPHAYRLRWRCLPNSFGRYQEYRSDGRITKLSMKHGRATRSRDRRMRC